MVRRWAEGGSAQRPAVADSGRSEQEQGISKAGNKHVRSLIVELAWLWPRWQPKSALS
jgi:transposase